MKKDIKILAIETSCDETSAAIIAASPTNLRIKRNYEITNGTNYPVILSNVVSSQIDLHAKTGGVVPEVAARAHIESMIPVVQEALARANCKSQNTNHKQIQNSNDQNHKVSEFGIRASDLLQDVTHLAVTAGPGLIGSLLVGFNTAKAMAYALDLPIVPINHIEGHIYSAMGGEMSNVKCQMSNEISNNKNQKVTSYNLQAKSFPILALTVSGGHTSLTLMRDHGKYETIGQTRDDAAGEAFDKVAKLLELGYPGGPAVSKLADEFRKSQVPNHKSQTNQKNQIQNIKQSSNETMEQSGSLRLPRPMIKDKSFDFSFSGLKTAVLDVVKSLNERELKNRTAEICTAFEDAAVDVLVTKTLRAVAKYQPKSVILAGGVAANKRLREELAGRLSQITNHKKQITNNYQYSNSKSEKAESQKSRCKIDRDPDKSASSGLQATSYNLILPPAEFCGDNAAMIGLAAYYHIVRGDVSSWNQIKIDSNLKM